jgi:hypothetical protein
LPVPAHIPDPTLWSNVPVNGDPLALFMYTNDYCKPFGGPPTLLLLQTYYY